MAIAQAIRREYRGHFIYNCLSEKLEKDLHSFMGWLGAYLFSITGHRTGVLTNLKQQEAMKVETDESTGACLILVSNN